MHLRTCVTLCGCYRLPMGRSITCGFVMSIVLDHGINYDSMSCKIKIKSYLYFMNSINISQRNKYIHIHPNFPVTSIISPPHKCFARK